MTHLLPGTIRCGSPSDDLVNRCQLASEILIREDQPDQRRTVILTGGKLRFDGDSERAAEVSESAVMMRLLAMRLPAALFTRTTFLFEGRAANTLENAVLSLTTGLFLPAALWALTRQSVTFAPGVFTLRNCSSIMLLQCL